MSTNHLLILCTCPDRKSADNIAGSLIDEGLAACVTILGPVSSHYRWQGKRESAEEILLLIKSHSRRYAELEQAIGSLHPYELPEIIAVPVEHGLPDYLDWIDECTVKKS